MVAERLSLVRARIGEAAERAGRAVEDVTLIAVTKTRTVDEILSAYEAGQRDFGENRAWELAEKAPQLPTDIRWHFVGGLQSRKAKTVRPLTHLLHSMDRRSLARRWAGDEAPPCLLQVNIGEEPQKHGVAPADVAGALDEIEGEGIRIVGLMAIPPAPEVPEDSRPYFAGMARLAAEHRRSRPHLEALSMGMTDDFEVAVEEGATMVRVGRAIFGPRSG